ncbi:MAG: 50S ribosomal protein L30 [Burkholderiales bacterium]|nr:50S ribosomal protein L30 [Pseudomonadota bacterium]MCC7068347.1 50S ribosomal protein L30 [Burkholderiales bacterium]MCZ2134504.1 50S ribosomal protein L30 [Burkholderiales bacterium]
MVAVKTFKVKLVKSPIGAKANHVATVQGLGLKRMGQVRELQDTPAIRGMVNAVRHLVVAVA